MDEDVSQQPGLGAEDFPGFPADDCPAQLPDLRMHHSTVADVLKERPDLYDKLRQRRTPNDVGLGRCIKTGIDNRGHPMVKTMGLVAGDAACYDVFQELFDLVIQRHVAPAAQGLGAGAPGRHPAAGMASDGLNDNRMDVAGRFVVSTELRASRCLSDFHFPPAMTRDEFEEVERLVTSAVMQLPAELRGEYHALRGSASYVPQPGGMDRADEAVLGSRGLLFFAPDSTLRLCSGSGRHWPHGRGVFASHKKDLALWVNEQEHLRATIKRPGDSLQSCYRDLVTFFSCLERGMAVESTGVDQRRYAVSDRLGFLNSNPVNLGTGLQAFIVVKLPLLSAQDEQGPGATWQTWCGQQRVQARRANAQNTYAPPDAFELTNLDRLGCSEVDLLNLLMKVTSYLIQMEMRLEAGHPIDDLLAQSVVGSTEGDAAAAGDASGTVAAMVFDGLFSSVVGELRPLPEAGEAEEIRGPTDPAKEAPTPSRLVSPRGLAASPSSRPNTGASVWTLNTHSEASGNGAHAEDVIANLMEAEVAAHDAELAAQGSPRSSGTTTWKYWPANGMPIPTRVAPEIEAPRTGIRLQPGELVQVEEERPGADGVTFLKLAGNRGWLFDKKPGVGVMCVKAAAPAFAGFDVEAVRARALEVMLSASEDGTLGQLVASVQSTRSQHGSEQQPQAGKPSPDQAHLDAMRQKAREALLASFVDGSLESALGSVHDSMVAAEQEAQTAAATKVQSIQRGRKARQDVATIKATRASADGEAAPDINDLRMKAHTALEQAFSDGSLEPALEQVFRDVAEEAAATKVQAIQRGRLARQGTQKLKEEREAQAKQQAEPVWQPIRDKAGEALLEAAENGTLQQLLLAVREEMDGASARPMPVVVPFPPSKPKVGAAPRSGMLARYKKDGLGGRSTAALLLDAVSERDRRIGELTALVREAQVRIVQQDEQCSHMQSLVATARSDLGHIELDIEWHRRALDDAEGRRADLEAGHRKLRLELDQKHLDVKHLDMEASAVGFHHHGGGAFTARSELSTTTISTAATTAPAFLQTPRQHLPGAVLEPLAPRR